MNHLQALICDVDGTLADTEEIHRQAFNRAFKEFGLNWDWTPRLYEDLLFVSGGRERITNFGAELAARFPDRDRFLAFVRDLHRTKTRIYAEMLTSGEVGLRPGVARLLGEARAAGIKLAIATSSAFSNAKTLLDNTLGAGWMAWFSAIETCDSVDEKKPSPAVYTAVLRRLAVPVDHCMAIEDTDNGLQAAQAAGLATVITTHYFTRGHQFPNAVLVVDTLGEPDHPMTVAAGESYGQTYVDLKLLDRLLVDRRAAAGAI